MRDWRRFAVQLKFLAVGGVAVAVDAGVYALIQAVFDPAFFVGKAGGFIAGAMFAYLANWRFTFGQRRGRFSEIIFVAVYLGALVLNVLVNTAVLGIAGVSSWSLMLAFLTATACSATWNYVGMSLFVFRTPTAETGRKETP